MSATTLEHGHQILDTMLGYLGFVVRIEKDPNHPDGGLQVYTEEADLLIGRRGQRLEDMQYLVNRLIQAHDPKAPRIRVDIEHHRTMREDAMLEKVRSLADSVRVSGRSVRLQPMNSYERRIVHNAFKDDPDIATESSEDRGRMKRIRLIRRSR